MKNIDRMFGELGDLTESERNVYRFLVRILERETTHINVMVTNAFKYDSSIPYNTFTLKWSLGFKSHVPRRRRFLNKNKHIISWERRIESRYYYCRVVFRIFDEDGFSTLLVLNTDENHVAEMIHLLNDDYEEYLKLKLVAS